MLHDEHTITLAQAAMLLPHKPHPSTVWRWCRHGINGVKLEHLQAGGRLITSIEAVERFCRALSEDNANAVAC